MKTLKITIALAFLFSPLLWTPAFAYSGGEVWTKGEKASMEKSYSMERAFRTHEFLGEPVKNASGETLGKVSDFVFNQHGRIEYVILAHRRGLTEKLIPIPYDIVKATPGTKVLMVDISKTSLANAPSFTKNEWKEFDNPEWTKKVHSYYESASGMEPKAQERPMKMEHQGMKSPQTEQRGGYKY
jgi:sporulation protein YlmC with PRC-barrel domain